MDRIVYSWLLIYNMQSHEEATEMEQGLGSVRMFQRNRPMCVLYTYICMCVYIYKKFI
jgi:hypothetical protein